MRRSIMSERSIPAHAGEPNARAEYCQDAAVYPRPRGGTGASGRASSGRRGLSPPTRGNPLTSADDDKYLGSIPAHAGEPAVSPPPRRLSGVYPRPRGGTPCGARAADARSGLSPPTRGNRRRTRGRCWRTRSIPAHAGEPVELPTRPMPPRVYPRPRGGTRRERGELRPKRREIEGLSPPTRGNPRRYLRVAGHRGSIPAHAGEPATGS